MHIDEARKAVKVISRKITAGNVEPFNGAMLIWKEILDRLGDNIPEDLWIFKSNASAIEDCRFNFETGGAEHADLIGQLEAEIIEAAKSLAVE